MKLVVLPLCAAVHFTSKIPWAAISITTYDFQRPILSKKNRVGLLHLDFVDTDDPELPNKTGFITENQIFSDEYANKILDFFSLVRYKIKIMMIHCEAGKSRSPAVAAALETIFYKKKSNWFVHFDPNILVYQRILEAAQNRGEYNGPIVPKLKWRELENGKVF